MFQVRLLSACVSLVRRAWHAVQARFACCLLSRTNDEPHAMHSEGLCLGTSFVRRRSHCWHARARCRGLDSPRAHPVIYLYDGRRPPPRPFCCPHRYLFQDVWATCIHPDDHKAFFDNLSMQLFRTPGHQSEFKKVLKVGVVYLRLLFRLVCTHNYPVRRTATLSAPELCVHTLCISYSTFSLVSGLDDFDRSPRRANGTVDGTHHEGQCRFPSFGIGKDRRGWRGAWGRALISGLLRCCELVVRCLRSLFFCAYVCMSTRARGACLPWENTKHAGTSVCRVRAVSCAPCPLQTREPSECRSLRSNQTVPTPPWSFNGVEA